MDEKLVVGKWEAVFMLVNILSIKSLTVYPSLLKEISSSGCWLGGIFGSVIALLLTGFMMYLYRKDTSFSYAELMEKRYGNTFANCIVIIAVISMIVSFSYFVNFIANSLSVTHLANTPRWVLCLLMIIPALHGAIKGLGAAVRITALCAIAVVIFYGVTFLSVIIDSNGSGLYPIFGKSYPAFFKGALLSITAFSDFYLLLFIMPNIDKKKDIFFIWKRTIMISSAIFVLMMIMMQSSFVPEAYSTVSSIDRAEAYVKLGRFYARTERFFSVIWLSSYICSFTVYAGYITHFVRALTGFDKRAVVAIVGVVVFVLSLSPTDLTLPMLILSALWILVPILTGFKKGELK
ncbi:MAG: GerAB/ArcD/ProY family transporter [Eubacteriales bacterium]|nr:GerAB/ArcD/ProY family transporter [Eubacteriales bacterium]